MLRVLFISFLASFLSNPFTDTEPHDGKASFYGTELLEINTDMGEYSLGDVTLDLKACEQFEYACITEPFPFIMYNARLWKPTKTKIGDKEYTITFGTYDYDSVPINVCDTSSVWVTIQDDSPLEGPGKNRNHQFLVSKKYGLSDVVISRERQGIRFPDFLFIQKNGNIFSYEDMCDSGVE